MWYSGRRNEVPPDYLSEEGDQRWMAIWRILQPRYEQISSSYYELKPGESTMLFGVIPLRNTQRR